MLVYEGARFGGCGMYLLKSKPVFTWNLLDLKRVRREGAEPLSPGKHSVELGFKYDGLGEATLGYNNLSGIGRGDAGTLNVDSNVVSTQTIERTIPLVMPLDDAFGIGAAGATPVDDRDYQAVRVHWQDRQADHRAGRAEADAAGSEEVRRRVPRGAGSEVRGSVKRHRPSAFWGQDSANESCWSKSAQGAASADGSRRGLFRGVSVRYPCVFCIKNKELIVQPRHRPGRGWIDRRKHNAASSLA
jgi:hypothetical protein